MAPPTTIGARNRRMRDNGFTEKQARSRSVLLLSAIEGVLLSWTSGDTTARRALR